jgi:hypothetical protein
MESTVVCLRDWGKLVKVWINYCELKLGGENSPGKFNMAISNFNNATSQIRELAQIWGMDFIYITDLVDDASASQPGGTDRTLVLL